MSLHWLVDLVISTLTKASAGHTPALRCVVGRDVRGAVTAASAVLCLAGSADHHQQLLHPLRSSCHAPGHALVSFGSHRQHRGFGRRCSLVPRLAAAAGALQMWCQTTRSCPETPSLLHLAYLCGCLLPACSEASRISFKNSRVLFMRRIFQAQSGGRAARYSLEFAGSVSE